MFDILEKLIDEALSLGARYAEARLYRSPSNMIMTVNGNVIRTVQTTDFGYAMRVIYENGIGFASTNDPESVKDLPKRAIREAKAAQRDSVRFSEERFEEYKYKVDEKKPVADMSTEARIALLKELDDYISSGMKLRSQRMIMLHDIIEHRRYMNSEGAKIESIIPRVEIFYNFTVLKNGDAESSMSSYGRSGGYEHYERLRVSDKMREALIALEKVLEESRPFASGYYDVILGPEVIGLASHESCGHPTEADRIFGREAAQAGESFIDPEGERRLGKKIGSDVVNVVDDPTVENSFGFYLYDDEGVKARRRYLYKEGYINELLLNREYAALIDKHSNAAARSSEFDREPIPRMANTFVEPQDRKIDEMLEDIKRGIRIESYTEWNIDDMRRNQRYVGTEARYIEDGEKKFRVRRPVIELTTKTRRSSIDAVGNDLEFFAANCGKGDPMQGVPVYIGGPHVRMRNVYIYPSR